MVYMNIKKILIFMFLCVTFFVPCVHADNLKVPAQICKVFRDRSFAEAIAGHLNKTSTNEIITQDELNTLKSFIQLPERKKLSKISSIDRRNTVFK